MGSGGSNRATTGLPRMRDAVTSSAGVAPMSTKVPSIVASTGCMTTASRQSVSGDPPTWTTL